jgi:hypothetical protein
MTDEQKFQIETLSLEAMLLKFRYGDPSDPLLTGVAGEYFAERLARLRRVAGDSEYKRVSRWVGHPSGDWDEDDWNET